MVYSRAGSLDLFSIFGCMTSNFMCLSFSTLRPSSLGRIDIIFWLFEPEDGILYNMYNITQISILDSHCPGPKQEVGNRNSSLFLPLFFFLPVMHFAN